MSSVQERLQLKRVPLDTWNIREQLCLASAVVRSGDQNWMSVSRALKTVGEPNRPPDWYSQKSCAAQYGALLEHVETPKRKKRSSEGAVETPQESILKRLTQERVVEIQKTIAEINQQYEVLKSDINEARNPATTEERLREMWAEIEAAKRARERESARRAAWLKEREERRARVDRVWRPPAAQPVTSASVGPVVAPTPSSPLLTSLLKSSPVVTTPQHMSHPASVVETVSPSAGAPTLSMLLEKSGNTSPHENKHAAIEHIKSQLVQIEQQLKANSSPTPPPLVAPPVDIDDIEIKAEDVYAFRDVDIHTPVLHAHKHLRPSLDKLVTKEEQIVVSDPVQVITAPPVAPELKRPLSLPEVTAPETIPEDMMPIDIENVQPTDTAGTPTLDPAVRAAEALPTPIGFPEVRFPAPEIKVLEEIKEEIREAEVTQSAADKQADDIVLEDAPTPTPTPTPTAEPTDSAPVTDVQDEEPEEPPAPAGTQEAASIGAEGLPAPEDIPLPEADPEPAPQCTEPPLPPEPEPPLPEVKQEAAEPEMADQQEPDAEVKIEEATTEDDNKKGDEAEDSIPLKEMAAGAGAGPGAGPEPAARDADGEDAHTETDDDTPMELSRVEEMDGRKKRDYSRKKKPDSRTCSGSESAAEASAPESPMATDSERQHRLWKKSVLLVYGRLCAHKYASIFLRAISDEEAPGYSVVVRRPMDLTTIKRNIEAGVIRTTSEFQRDVLLMLTNALMYNSSEHSVYQMAKDMFEEAAGQLGILVAAQAHAGLVSPPAPARRKRRRDSDPPPPPPHAAPAAKRPH